MTPRAPSGDRRPALAQDHHNAMRGEESVQPNGGPPGSRTVNKAVGARTGRRAGHHQSPPPNLGPPSRQNPSTITAAAVSPPTQAYHSSQLPLLFSPQLNEVHLRKETHLCLVHLCLVYLCLENRQPPRCKRCIYLWMEGRWILRCQQRHQHSYKELFNVLDRSRHVVPTAPSTGRSATR